MLHKDASMIQTGKIAEHKTLKNIPQPVGDKILFGPDSTSKYSHVFSVYANDFAVIVGYNLSPGDSLSLEHVGGEGSGQFFSPVVDRGCSVQIICDVDSSMRITRPGRYRLRYDGNTPIGAFYVEITK